MGDSTPRILAGSGGDGTCAETISIYDPAYPSFSRICFTFVSLIHASSLIALSFTHLIKLCIHGYCPDSLNLSSIIHALCDSNRFSEAHSRFLSSLASSSGSGSIIPDERTCNVIIARLLDWGKKPHVTLRVVHRIIAVKPHFVPSLTYFNRLIDQLCSCSCVHSAHILFFHMKSLGYHPNEVSYTTLINGYSRIGELGFAQKLLDEMSECGVRPNLLTYSVLISGALHNRDIKLYTSLLQKLWTTMADENHNQTVNHAAFSNLIYTLCQKGMFKSVFDMAETKDCLHGDETKFNYTPSENTYKILIECLCSQEPDLIKAKKGSA
ncbi:hypothetical protein L2E82_19188 [Cichorium intybus]|uniref:Uncharacterized protein n=1 Tax=Cichorium intybus TaxID=13427 RepID=A0ACB9FCQ5_CICIN|nr:hypothetical protein L2E82_19188 [Cichorium intybus]